MNNKNQSYNLQLDREVNYKQGLMLVLKHVKPYIKGFVLVSIFLLIATIIGSSILPLLTKRAIDVNIANKDTQGLIVTSAIFVGFAILNTLFSYLRIYITGKISQKILFNIRRDIFVKIQSLPSKFFAENQSGDIIQRLTGNVDGINNFFSEGLIRILGIFFTVVIVLISMFLQNWVLGLIALAGGILMIFFIFLQGKIVERPIADSLKKESAMSAYVQETLDGFIAIQTLNQQRNWLKNFKTKTLDYYNTIKRVSLVSSLSNSSLTFLTIFSVAFILVFSLNLFSKNILSIGTVILFLSYSQDLYRNIGSISELWRNMKTGIASAERLSDILALQSDIVDVENPYSPKTLNGDIEFVDVDFSYEDGQKVLSDINFKVKSGQYIAIVGPTGGGKTTFVNLIARLYDVDNGEILIDGVPIKQWNSHTLRKNIGYLIQDVFLFEDTITNNLRYNNPKITEKDILNMLESLGVKSMIDSLPKGLDTVISSESKNLSAGQKQIIALTRILLRNPKILILDEATARIDTKSERMLQAAIERASVGRTTFVIAHRLSTIFNADSIILIKENTILEKGTHKELLAKKGLYWEMYSHFINK